MFDKKKLNFWRLAFIFFGLAIIILFLLWNSPQQQKAQMMSGSMGSTMKQMHVSNITIYDLLKNDEAQNGMQSTMSEMASHHQNQGTGIYKMNFLITAMIFLLLPLIIGGTIVLAIVWLK